MRAGKSNILECFSFVIYSYNSVNTHFIIILSYKITAVFIALDEN